MNPLYVLPLLALPLSNLSLASKKEPAGELGAKDFALRVENTKWGSYSYVTARREAMCVVTFADDDEEAAWIGGEGTNQTRWRTRETSVNQPNQATARVGGERLVLDDPSAGPHLERVVVELAKSEGKFERKAALKVPLTVVAKNDAGVTVYAYRAGKHVFFLTRTLGGPANASFRSSTSQAEIDQGMGVAAGTSDCGFVGGWLNLDEKRGGAVGELTAAVQSDPHDKQTIRRFVVHTSLSKTSRDAEPMFSATIRVLPPN